MKISSQNCRGLGNQPAVQGLHDLVREEEPDILFLSETKLTEKEMERFRWSLKMPNMIVQNCRGRSGGARSLLEKGGGCEFTMEREIPH
jgi:exonuclease III